MTPLATIARRKRALNLARFSFETAIREAVITGVPKVDVAKAAGISRPTLDRILRS